MTLRWISAFLCITICAVSFAAQPPRFNYQARLTDSGGQPLDGPVTLFFSVFQGGDENTPNSGTNIYSETVPMNLSGGIVSHTVGTGTPTLGALKASQFSYNFDMFIQVAVNDPGNIVLPRGQLQPVPFAIAKHPSSLFGQFGGSGVDGEHIATNESYPNGQLRHQYTTFTVPLGTTLTTGNRYTFIGVEGRCTIAGTISATAEGNSGGTGGFDDGNGFPGEDAARITSNLRIAPRCGSGGGGGGGSTANFLGGAGGGAQERGGQGFIGMDGTNALTDNEPSLALSGGATAGSGGTLTDDFHQLLLFPGASGGGGAAETSTQGGDGGRGGGVIYIECDELDFTGGIQANGGTGGAGSGIGGPAAGGGGGGGGVVLVRARKIITNSGTVTADPGAGGPGSIITNKSGGMGAPGFWDVVEVH